MTGLLALMPLPGDALAPLRRASTNSDWEIRDAANFLLVMNTNTHDPNWRYFRDAFQ
jgi:hypothetical protein